MTVAVSLNTILGVALVADVRLTAQADPKDGHDCCQKLFVLGPSAAIAFSGIAATAGSLLKSLFTGEPISVDTAEHVEALPRVLAGRFKASFKGPPEEAPSFLLATASVNTEVPAFCRGRVYLSVDSEFTFDEQTSPLVAIGSGGDLFRSLAKDDPKLAYHAMKSALDGMSLCIPLERHFYGSEKDPRVGGLLLQAHVQPGQSSYIERTHRVMTGARAGEGWSMRFDISSRRWIMTDLSTRRTVSLAYPWEPHPRRGTFNAMEDIMAPRRETLRQTPAGGNHLVFDWHQAARLIRDRRPRVAKAGLDGVEDAWCTIYRNGQIVRGFSGEYAELESSTHIPSLDLDGERIPCWAAKHERPNWGNDTNWPEGSIHLVERGQVYATFGVGSTGAADAMVRELHDIATSDEIGCWWCGELEKKADLLRLTITHTPPDPEDRERPPFMRRDRLEWVSDWGTPEAIAQAFRAWMEAIRSKA